jgi:branched-chain amino acid transport system permease protein
MFPDETIGEATGIQFTEFPEDVWGPAYADFSAAYAPWWLILAFAAVVYLFFRNLKRSAFGRAMMCIREDEIAAQAMGIHVPWTKIAGFALAAVVAGMAGAFYFHKDLAIAPGEFNLLLSIQILLMVVLGGLGSYSGAACAAVLLGVIPEVLRRIDLRGVEWLPEAARGIQLGEYQTMIYAVLLIALIRLRPDGLLGLRELPGPLERRIDAWRLRRRASS